MSATQKGMRFFCLVIKRVVQTSLEKQLDPQGKVFKILENLLYQILSWKPIFTCDFPVVGGGGGGQSRPPVPPLNPPMIIELD